ncbi:hypothetical protein AgCh_009777 [Apium graveolens]
MLTSRVINYDIWSLSSAVAVKLSETKSYLETAKGKITKLTAKLSEQQLLIQELEDDIFKVLKQLNMLPDTQISLIDEHGTLTGLKDHGSSYLLGHKIGTHVPLFKELSDKDVDFFRTKFAGSQADRIVKTEAEVKQISDILIVWWFIYCEGGGKS